MQFLRPKLIYPFTISKIIIIFIGNINIPYIYIYSIYLGKIFLSNTGLQTVFENPFS